MPLTEIDPNISSRNSLSRASNISGRTSIKGSQNGGLTDTLSNNAGVLSMLKTTTEIGDIDLLTNRSSRNLKRPLGTFRRPTNLTQPRPSSNYSRAASIRSKASSLHSNPDVSTTGKWPYGRFTHASSIDLPIRDDSRSGNNQHDINMTFHGSGRFEAPRSYSLTSTGTSYRRVDPTGPPSVMQNPGHPHPQFRGVYHHNHRVSPLAYRPASPALSDSYAGPHNKAMVQRRPMRAKYPQHPMERFHGSHNNEHQDKTSPQFYPRPSPHAQVPVQRSFQRDELPLSPDYEERDNTWIETQRTDVSQSRCIRNDILPPLQSNPVVAAAKHEGESSPDKMPTRKLTDSSNYIGFVQRVKKVLEERATRGSSIVQTTQDRQDDGIEPIEREQGAPDTSIARRLTREMIQAAIGPPSDSGAMSPEAPASVISHIQADDSTIGGNSVKGKESMDLLRSPSFPEVSQKNIAPGQTTSTKSNAIANGGENSSTPTSECRYVVESQVVQSQAEKAQDDFDNKHVDSSLETMLNPPEASPPAGRLLVQQGSAEAYVGNDYHDYSQSALVNLDRLPSFVHTHNGNKPEPPSSSSLNPKSAIGLDLRASLSSTHSTGSVLPLSTHSSAQSNSRPASADMPTWATSSIIARRSFNPEFSHHSSVSSSTELEHNSGFGNVSSSARGPGPVEEIIVADRPRSAINNHPTQMPTVGLVPTGLFESRFSAVKQFHFPLPDLTEDSQEEHSTTNLRILGSKVPPNFRSVGYKKKRIDSHFQPPVIAETEILPSESKSTPQPSGYVSRKIGETRNMPSLRFSNTDLTTKLNIALGLDPTGFSDETTSANGDDSMRLAVAEAHGDGEKRARYRSYFTGAELTELQETCEDSNEIEPSGPNTAGLQLVSEIDRLSIPSLNGLTTRLSELLPAIKKGDAYLSTTSSDLDMEDNDNENEPGCSPARMMSLERKRASLVSALTAGTVAQSKRVGSSRESSWPPREKGDVNTMKDLPLLPTEGKDPRPSITTMSSARGTRRIPEGTIGLGFLESNLSVIEETRKSHSLDKGRTSASSNNKTKRPTVLPLSGDDAAIIQSGDVSDEKKIETGAKSQSLSAHPNHGKDSVDGAITGRSKARRARSLILTPDATERIVRSMSPGPHLGASLVPRTAGSIDSQRSHPSGKGIINSLKRRIGTSSTVSQITNNIVQPEFLHPGERAVSGPGDRYPTTALTPPYQANIDDTRSYFSDDSSVHVEATRTRDFRKRLTRLRMRYSVHPPRPQTSSRALSAVETQSEPNAHPHWNGSNGSRSIDSQLRSTHADVVTVYDQPPSGMSKLEFRAKRLVEKFRIFWCRGGYLIRSMNRTQRQHPSYGHEPNVYQGT